MGETAPSPSPSSAPQPRSTDSGRAHSTGSGLPDYFALLGQPRRPWLEPELLKARFHELSSATHPDRVHGGSAAEKEAATRQHAELNAAYHCLVEPKERLGHLLALERGNKPTGIDSVPEDAMELFFRVGQLCRSVDGFLTSKSAEASPSPLLKVKRFKAGLQWTGEVQTQLSELQGHWEKEQSQLQMLTEQWNESQPPLAECEQAYRRLSYLSRWLSQLREKLTLLASE